MLPRPIATWRSALWPRSASAYWCVCPLPKAPTQSQTGGCEDTWLRTSTVAPLAPRSALSLAFADSGCSVPVCCPLRPFGRSAFLPLQDQPADIRAWVDYHYALGLPRVYLFDNNSTPPLSSALQDHIDDGIVQCELAPHQLSGLRQHVLQDTKLQAMLPCGWAADCVPSWVVGPRA